MQNGAVRIDLRTEYIPSQPRSTGDALLAGILYEQYRDGPRALAELPVERLDGVPLASEIMLEYPATPRGLTQYGNIASEPVRDVGHVNRVHGKIPRVDSTTGAYKTIDNHYVAYATPHVWFFVRGDLGRIEELLKRVHFIGTLRSKGYGEITGFHVSRLRNPDPLMAVLSQGRVLRPIPTRLRSRFPEATDFVERVETWKAPYHSTDQAEACMVPAASRPMDFQAIRALAA